MAKSDELVTYITQRIVRYMETPRDVRRRRKQSREPWVYKWFGMLPLALNMWIKSARKGRKERH
ncbi:YqzE family protein [Paenibacillus terrae]|uniref:YqzE family protein n=1 Tax=Paenibacillus terrae (strain HPL-003) TaxID=985665 RepID=G7W4M8_PAETH|nr:YqzE family protein [Paenibacillus terrae]AET60185.1 hypothetical protein HPL003_17205 [Paenibacillus terrae HPL-003]